MSPFRGPEASPTFEVRARLPRSPVPTLLRTGPYRFFFFMADGHEAPHVHVERDDFRAKIWLDPVRVAYASSFHPLELRRIQRIVEEQRYRFLEQWDEYFGL
jgi:Domain of unknown function (DUF4160)